MHRVRFAIGMVSRAILEEAITTYNEYRSPMATAELVDRADCGFTVRFRGPFCRMCCDYDYFEDLIYELDALDADAESIAIDEMTYDEDETFVVEYTAEA